MMIGFEIKINVRSQKEATNEIVSLLFDYTSPVDRDDGMMSPLRCAVDLNQNDLIGSKY